MFRYCPDSRPFYAYNLSKVLKEIIYFAKPKYRMDPLQYPKKAASQLLLHSAASGQGFSPVCSLRSINHSVGPFPRFFFQNAFSISFGINVLQTALQCTSLPLKEGSLLPLRHSVEVKTTLFLNTEHL